MVKISVLTKLCVFVCYFRPIQIRTLIEQYKFQGGILIYKFYTSFKEES